MVELGPVWPAEPADLCDALKQEAPIFPTVDKWTSPELTVATVQDVVCCGEVAVILIKGGMDVFKPSNLAIWHLQGSSGGADNLKPIMLQSFYDDALQCSRLWPLGLKAFIAHCGMSLWRVELPALFPESNEECQEERQLVARASQLFTLPSGAHSLACSGMISGLSSESHPYFAMFIKAPTATAKGPVVVFPGQSMQQLPAARLCVWQSLSGLKRVVDVPRLSEQLVASPGSRRRICVWRVMRNEVPEEAERGEFMAVNLESLEDGASSTGAMQAICLTQGAGRVGEAAVSDNGEYILLQANFSTDKPITTHMSLVLLAWPLDAELPCTEKRNLIVGQHICSFHFLPLLASIENEHEITIAVTKLVGVDAETSLWACSTSTSPKQIGSVLPSPITSRSLSILAAHDGPQSLVVFGTESSDLLPRVCCQHLKEATSGRSAAVKQLELQQPDGMADFSIEKVTYTHGDHEVTALLFERTSPVCPQDAPLLVHVHGGPAIGMMCSMRSACDHTRYPFRHYLMTGYRVFQPMFRGTLGFGDAWAQGNIGQQGSLQGDLGDVLAGLDWLNTGHPRLKGTITKSRTGIWGGSYGGYMTIRALCTAPDRFAAGVAQYGFVHNRWMTYEGGDFTWEDEYLVPPSEISGGELPVEGSLSQEAANTDTSDRPRKRSTSDVWPLPPELEASDVFNGLHHICTPMLLMHGEKDDICPLSQSQVVFHMLEKKGVPTGLIVYPGEGHGFDEPEHQQDRDRRMLAWWSQHIPCT